MMRHWSASIQVHGCPDAQDSSPFEGAHRLRVKRAWERSNKQQGSEDTMLDVVDTCTFMQKVSIPPRGVAGTAGVSRKAPYEGAAYEVSEVAPEAWANLKQLQVTFDENLRGSQCVSDIVYADHAALRLVPFHCLLLCAVSLCVVVSLCPSC